MINIEKTIAYINSVLGDNCKIEPFLPPGLPFYLEDSYQFYKADVLNAPCLFLWANESGEPPSSIEKHCQAVRKVWADGEVVYLAEVMSQQHRNRLIHHKVPFIVPGTQLYLPMLGIDLREHFRKLKNSHAKPEGMSPTAQLVILWQLLKGSMEGVNSAQMAEHLGCTRVAAARAYDEIAAFEWAQIEKIGNQKILAFDVRGRELWQLIQEHMQNPIRKTRWVIGSNSEFPGVLAGESALAKYTLMSEPEFPVYAVAANEWKGIQKTLQLDELRYPEPGCFGLQTWRYTPELLAEQACVDRLSLFLSLRHEADPRKSMAADELLEQINW
ncbi:MAG: hypothetical protein WCY88_02625 [Spongiibacteraceae bacterium]